MTAETLLQELQGSARHAQHFLFADTRFHRADVLELLLAQSRSTQLTHPGRAACIAELAIGIADRIQNDPDTRHSTLVQARCLGANSYRLAKLLDTAEFYLSKAVELLDPMPRYDEAHRALYCRTLSLVRWEQGRLDEAFSLLRQALRLFHAGQTSAEEATCSMLLALLADEMGLPEEVETAMSRHLGDWFDPASQPWLTSRALLTYSAAASKTKLVSHVALDEGIRLQAYVTDRHERLRLFALEGRARARLGFFDQAEKMIDCVRRRHLADRRMIDATLSSLDLLALRVAAHLPPSIDELLDDLESIGHDPITEIEIASAALDRFVSWVGGDEDPWTSQRVAATWFLQTHRFKGFNPAPIPFA